MKYSKRLKSSVIRKVLPPENKSVPAVAKEMGISDQTIYNWKNQALNGTLTIEDDAVSPISLNTVEKFSLLIEGKTQNNESSGAWLREKGLHSEHLNLFEQELRDMLKNKDNKYKEENTKLKKENRALAKELQRKEKALAEVAALLALKKKVHEIWGDKEDA